MSIWFVVCFNSFATWYNEPGLDLSALCAGKQRPRVQCFFRVRMGSGLFEINKYYDVPELCLFVVCCVVNYLETNILCYSQS